MTILIRYNGRFRRQSDGQRWRIRHDGQLIGGDLKLYPDRWTASFNGMLHGDLDLERQQAVIGGTSRDLELYTVRGLLQYRLHKLLDLLADPDIDIGQRTVEGHRCYVVSREQGPSKSVEFLVSPRQSYLIVGWTERWKGKETGMCRLTDVHRDAAGQWIPRKFVLERRRSRPDPVPWPPDFAGDNPVAQPEPPPLPAGLLPLEERRTLTIVHADVAFEPADFSIRVAYGATVEDHRTGFRYINDPWWPEVQAMLKERFANWFAWPIVDVSPLRQMASPPHPPGEKPADGIVGRAAPPLRARVWINSDPLDWAGLKGKVTLVKFWSLGGKTWGADSDGRQHAAMRKLHETFHPSGFEILAVHAPTEDDAAVLQFARELRLPYAIAVNTDADGIGRTLSAAFDEGNTYQSAYLVDGVGKVHAIPDGKLVETVVNLLKNSGARDVTADMLPDYRLPPEAIQYIALTWRKSFALRRELSSSAARSRIHRAGRWRTS